MASTVATVYPEKRTYVVRSSPMTEAGIDAGWSRDLFVALGDDLGDDAWSVRLQYKPLVRLIWFGAIIMALGGLLAGTDRRYRVRAAQSAAQPAVVSSPPFQCSPDLAFRGPARLSWRFLLPVVLFGLLVVVFVIGLGKDPALVPSPLVGKPAPEFTLAPA